jgi:hypothetical protein
MRLMALGILLVGVMVAGGSASAVDAGSAPAAGNAAPASPAKQHARMKPKNRPLPLAAAMEGPRTADVPAASIRAKQPPTAQRSWTGTYVGVDAGPAK